MSLFTNFIASQTKYIDIHTFHGSVSVSQRQKNAEKVIIDKYTQFLV